MPSTINTLFFLYFIGVQCMMIWVSLFRIKQLSKDGIEVFFLFYVCILSGLLATSTNITGGFISFCGLLFSIYGYFDTILWNLRRQ